MCLCSSAFHYSSPKVYERIGTASTFMAADLFLPDRHDWQICQRRAMYILLRVCLAYTTSRNVYDSPTSTYWMMTSTTCISLPLSIPFPLCTWNTAHLWSKFAKDCLVTWSFPYDVERWTFCLAELFLGPYLRRTHCVRRNGYFTRNLDKLNARS